jgi:hypothetical protein
MANSGNTSSANLSAPAETEFSKISNTETSKVPEVVVRHSEAVAALRTETWENCTALNACVSMSALAADIGPSFPIFGVGEGQYEPIAATGDGIVLAETERTKLEREFLPLLETANTKRYYDVLTPKLKNVVAKSYETLKSSGLEQKKIVSGTGMVAESMYGFVSAKKFVEEWKRTGKDPNIELVSIATRLKPIIRKVPELAPYFDMAELEEIDRLQLEVMNAIIAQNRQEIAQSDARIAQNRQDITKLKEDIRKLDILLKKY